jgi:hypothetical protein
VKIKSLPQSPSSVFDTKATVRANSSTLGCQRPQVLWQLYIIIHGRKFDSGTSLKFFRMASFELAQSLVLVKSRQIELGVQWVILVFEEEN